MGLKENNQAKILESARGYANLLQEHIYKEDNILYPIADETLSDKKQKSILLEFRKAEIKRFAKGIKDKYIKMAKKLEKDE